MRHQLSLRLCLQLPSVSTAYHHPNGRVEHRTGGGRFRQSTLEDVGVARTETNRAGQRQCAKCPCVWEPILVHGECPECGGTESTALPPAADAPRVVRPDAEHLDPVWFRKVRDGRHPATVDADGGVIVHGERLFFQAGEELAPGTRVEVWLARDFMARPLPTSIENAG